jgi:hypothetical protein
MRRVVLEALVHVAATSVSAVGAWASILVGTNRTTVVRLVLELVLSSLRHRSGRVVATIPLAFALRLCASVIACLNTATVKPVIAAL